MATNPVNVLGKIASQLETLDSKIRLLNQRISVIEKNQKVISETLVSQRKKLEALVRKVEERTTDTSQSLRGAVSENQKYILSLSEKVESLENELNDLKSQINELKYFLENINPLAYVTYDDLPEIIDERVERKLRELRSGRKGRSE